MLINAYRSIAALYVLYIVSDTKGDVTFIICCSICSCFEISLVGLSLYILLCFKAEWQAIRLL